ncbi:DUF4288 domain-containing protein [Deinococcus pimensis]|uniref:DUF4288 domain-containing protein n=1 Tax=Deinococcus pimensis TaxID=309888 RepID=UPI00069355B8|nr:DUF4288 domain-containing protein [Deinococcus pimensis]
MRYFAITLSEGVNDTTGERWYQENFLLLEASTFEEAQARVTAIAKQDDTSYENAVGETVTWKLLRIVDVRQVLHDASDEPTLYARHFRDLEGYRIFDAPDDED